MSAGEMRARALQSVHRRRLRARDFTIIADDCWGGGVYQHLGVPYATPLIGTLVPTPDFVHLVENLPRLLCAPLQSWEVQSAHTWGETTQYPVARLGGEVEVQFIHYTSFESAEEAWLRRLARVKWDRIFVKSSGDARVHPCTVEHLRRLEAVPYPTVCFTVGEHAELSRAVQLRYPVSNGAMQVLPSMHDFDVVGWLNGASGRPRPVYRIVERALNAATIPDDIKAVAQL